jgi:hypothetical protein
MEEDIPITQALRTTTYDELRTANRDEFYRGRNNAPAPAAPPPRPTIRNERPGPSSGGKVKNQYGDVWESTSLD